MCYSLQEIYYSKSSKCVLIDLKGTSVSDFTFLFLHIQI